MKFEYGYRDDNPRRIAHAVTLVAALMLGVLAVAALSGCGPKRAPAAQPAADDGMGTDAPGYLRPPGLLSATRDGAGGLSLIGHAPPGALVRMRSPTGDQMTTTAGADWRWSVRLTADPAPRMFAVEAMVNGRIVHADGALLVLPAPSPPAILLRSGFPSLPAPPAPSGLRIVTVDLDGAGGGGVSGYAPERSQVRLLVDGKPAGASQAERGGRFAMLDLDTGAPLSPGAHHIRIETPGAAVEGEIFAPGPVNPTALAVSPFRAERTPAGWRVAWRTPGGGTQTTLVLDPPHAAPAPDTGAGG